MSVNAPTLLDITYGLSDVPDAVRAIDKKAASSVETATAYLAAKIPSYHTMTTLLPDQYPEHIVRHFLAQYQGKINEAIHELPFSETEKKHVHDAFFAPIEAGIEKRHGTKAPWRHIKDAFETHVKYRFDMRKGFSQILNEHTGRLSPLSLRVSLVTAAGLVGVGSYEAYRAAQSAQGEINLETGSEKPRSWLMTAMHGAAAAGAFAGAYRMGTGTWHIAPLTEKHFTAIAKKEAHLLPIKPEPVIKTEGAELTMSYADANLHGQFSRSAFGKYIDMMNRQSPTTGYLGKG